jgi:hypothetical protein
MILFNTMFIIDNTDIGESVSMSFKDVNVSSTSEITVH